MKKLFFILTAFIFSTAAFARIELIPQEGEKPQQFVQIQANYYPEINSKQSSASIALGYNIDFAPFFAFTAVQYDASVFDAVLRTEWAPFSFIREKGEWRFGAAVNYHFQKNENYYKENNLIFEASVHWKTKKNFSFAIYTGYSWRFNSFTDIPDFNLYKGDITAKFEFNKIWKIGIEIFGAINSYSDFNYPFFFCPQLQLGLAYNFSQGLRFALQFDWGITDFLSSVMYINYARLSFGMRYSF